MKKIAKFLIVLGMMGQLSSCDYLDIVPDDVHKNRILGRRKVR